MTLKSGHVKHSYSSLFAGFLLLLSGTLLGYGIARQKNPELPVTEAAPSVTNANSVRTTTVTLPQREDLPSSRQESSAELAGSGSGSSDVVNAVQRVLQEDHPYRRCRALDELCASLDTDGAKAALDHLLRRKPLPPRDQDLLSPLLTRWAEIDPQGAANYAVNMHSLRVHAIYAVLPTWAARDPEAAMAWGLKSKIRDVRQYSVNSVVTHLAERDPKAALRMLEKLPRGESNIFYYSCIFDRVARKSPEEAAELAATIKSSLVRHKAAEQIAVAWGQSDPKAALDWLAQNSAGDSDTGLHSSSLEMVLSNWVDRDPQAAAEYATNLPISLSQQETLKDVAKAWAAKDPNAVAKWIDSLPKGPQAHKALEALVYAWAVNDPKAAAQYAQSLPSNPHGLDPLHTVALRWASTDAQGALEWARQQQDPAVERTVAALAVSNLALKNRPEAVNYISQLKSQDARSLAIRSFAQSVAFRDPAGALTWLMELPEGFPAKMALESEISTWTWNEQKAVAQWLEKQPAGRNRDTAVNKFAEQIASKDAPAAASWAQSISDAQLRDKRLQQVLGFWGKKNPEAARAWVLQQRFAQGEQQIFLDRINQGRPK